MIPVESEAESSTDTCALLILIPLGKLRLVLHFFSLIRNYLLHAILNEIL